MNPDLSTVLRAIEIVGAATEAGLKLYEAFRTEMRGADQATFERQYQEACRASDQIHDTIQTTIKR